MKQSFVRRWALPVLACTFALASSQPGWAAQSATPLKIDESSRVTLTGNVRPEANSRNDRGAVESSKMFEHLRLVMQRSAKSEAALDAFMERQQTPGSADFHRWLTPSQLGEQYGPSKADIATVSGWLEKHGFAVNRVSASGMLIDFSGTAGQIKEAFGTEIHNLQVKGQNHFANMQDPQIPAALASVIGGIASLHDFKPVSQRTPVTPLTTTQKSKSAVSPLYTVNADYQLVVPADLATIYDFNPVFSLGNAGQGQTVVLLERTDLYSNNDYYTFRTTFGLDKYKSSSFSVVHPDNCPDPGVLTGDDGEASVDVEWAAAAAPAAKIELASCADSSTNFGAFTALEGIIDADDANHRPSIVSLSYGSPESENGASGNSYIYHLYQQAASEGISVFVSSGDAGAAVANQNQEYATYGITVNALASTPFNLAAGGTDFGDSYFGTNSKYWKSTNSSVYSSAKSYIPEIPWNDSCASKLIATVLGFSTTYGANGACNNSPGNEFLDTAAGSGGPSACAHGNATKAPVTSGTCKGYAKPSWQHNLAGVPNDGVRDLPDVSMFAANGVWGHYFVLCYSNPAGGGVPCTGAPSGWAGAGGTSFVAPILAGVQALVNQAWGPRQGNPDYAYYAIAHHEYGSNGNSSCNSDQNGGGDCVFHDVTLGDIDVDCVGTVKCFDPSGAVGVLSLSTTVYDPAYRAHKGWDFATGIGTLDVTRLVLAWGLYH